jgi:hypothetical protein
MFVLTIDRAKLIFFISLFCVAPFIQASVKNGQIAPDFSLPGSDGKTYQLSDYRGKTVILEWTNHDCPYVRKHYESGNMQSLQKQLSNDGMIWFSVISSRPGSQGYVTPEGANELTTSRNAYPTSVLLDPEGNVGRLYGARTTPHMYIIASNGELVYQGGIDDKPSARKSSLEGAKNYVLAALEDMKANRPVQTAQTSPYGCSVKY